jgi:hypothetical protein
MSMREIDEVALLDNVELMINTLQYDSMRSAGKTKMNAPALVSLYNLKDVYTKLISKATPKNKEVV